MKRNKPLAVFTIIESDKLEKGIWRRIGSAFENRDGSLNVVFDALPVNGKVQIREDARKPSANAASPTREHSRL